MKRMIRVAGTLLLATIVAVGITMIPQKQILAAGDVAIDETNFPDEKFRKIVKKFDSNSDGVLAEAEAATVEELLINRLSYSDGISDLKGIEYFTKLKRLYCRQHNLTSLDVSKNVNLMELCCDGNQLTSLNVSGCKYLESLDCSSNQLAELDVSKCEELTRFYCFSNQLKSIDVSKCNDLHDFSCYDNQLESLDLSNNSILSKLDCRNNMLTSLDLSKNANLTSLKCQSNQLESLDVSKNTKLDLLSCSDNQLKSLDVSKSTVLRDLYCDNNKITSLNLSKNAALVTLFCYENQLTSLDMRGCPVLDRLDCYKNKLTGLYVSKSTELKTLHCWENQLQILDVSKNVNLYELDCSSNNLKSLNLTNNTKLSLLYCEENQLEILNIREQEKLFALNCSFNKLKKLDVRGKDALKYLSCFANEIKELDVNHAMLLNKLCLSVERVEEKRDGVDIYVFDEYAWGSEGPYVASELAVDRHTYVWMRGQHPTTTPTPKLNSRSIEIDLSNGDIPYTDNEDLLDAVSVLLQKCESDSLFDCVFDSENQIIHMDLDCDGNIDVDYLLVGYTFLKKADTCSIEDEIVFTKDQLPGTYYKEIAFVFADYYDVTFDANGGSGAMDRRRAFVGKKFVLPESGFVAPEGKEFAGWDLGAVGDSVEITADTVVKAQWKDIVYFIKVTDDGHGTATSSVASGVMGTEVTLKADPKEGYKFKKWQVISGGVTITDDKFVIGTEDVEIKAIFEALPATPTPTNTPTPKPDDPTPTPKPDDPTPTPIPDKEPSIADFVERLYTIALNRASEPEGKAFWVKEIEDGNRTGGDCAYFFLIEAPEFKNRGLSDEDFVETLYKTFFDRASEAEGKAFWVGQLKNKTMTRDQVIMGFIDSKEWCNVCADYGVKSGAPTAKAERASKNAINFATRLYTCCLGRTAEDGGLKYWSLALTNLEQTGCSAAKEFFTSTEFVNLKLKDDEYVKRLYKTFMDREPEAGEVSYWTGEIAKGTQTRSSVLASFGQSEEFTNICKKYGIDRGTI